MDFRTLALRLLGGQNPAQAVPPPQWRDGWMLPERPTVPPEGIPLQENDAGDLAHVAPGARYPTWWWNTSMPLQQEQAGYNSNLRPQQYSLAQQVQQALGAPRLGGQLPLRAFGQFNPTVLLDPSQVEWPPGRYGP